jgi:predicted ATPase
LKLIIKKFPPITKSFEIDLSKKVTLFVGVNNSGKTYLSQFIWGINKFGKKLLVSHKNKAIQFIKNQELQPITEEIVIDISNRFTESLKENNIGQTLFNRDMDIDFQIEFNLEKVKEFYEKEIKKIDIKKEIERREKEEKGLLKSFISIEEFMNFIIEMKIITNQISEEPLYMPSTRLFFPQFYKYIVKKEKDLKHSLLNNLDKLNERNRDFFQSSYTKAVEHLLDKLYDELEENQKENSFLNKIEELIEGQILVDKAEDIGMADISYQHQSGEKLPMYLSSSMVNQLATIYLYFKYWFKEDKDNFLLLDEPEMNLHPSKKIKLIELLLDYASSNKLLIATHSNTMAKTIINYIHLFDLKEKKAPEELQEFVESENLDLNLDINLSSNEIGIYYFTGNAIVSYKDDNETNIQFGTFTEIEDFQNRQKEYLMEELESYEE